ncbi:MAG: hypothetical protein WDW38_006677 [Sanguina aurantia]
MPPPRKHKSLEKPEHLNSLAKKRAPMDEMRQLIRILVKIMPNSIDNLAVEEAEDAAVQEIQWNQDCPQMANQDNATKVKEGCGNKVNRDQIHAYLTNALGEMQEPAWGVPLGWGAYVADIFTWVLGLEATPITQECAISCARRPQGRSWEAVDDQIRKLGLYPHKWRHPLKLSEVRKDNAQGAEEQKLANQNHMPPPTTGPRPANQGRMVGVIPYIPNIANNISALHPQSLNVQQGYADEEALNRQIAKLDRTVEAAAAAKAEFARQLVVMQAAAAKKASDVQARQQVEAREGAATVELTAVYDRLLKEATLGAESRKRVKMLVADQTRLRADLHAARLAARELLQTQDPDVPEGAQMELGSGRVDGEDPSDEEGGSQLDTCVKIQLQLNAFDRLKAPDTAAERQQLNSVMSGICQSLHDLADMPVSQIDSASAGATTTPTAILPTPDLAGSVRAAASLTKNNIQVSASVEVAGPSYPSAAAGTAALLLTGPPSHQRFKDCPLCKVPFPPPSLNKALCAAFALVIRPAIHSENAYNNGNNRSSSSSDDDNKNQRFDSTHQQFDSTHQQSDRTNQQFACTDRRFNNANIITHRQGAKNSQQFNKRQQRQATLVFGQRQLLPSLCKRLFSVPCPSCVLRNRSIPFRRNSHQQRHTTARRAWDMLLPKSPGTSQQVAGLQGATFQATLPLLQRVHQYALLSRAAQVDPALAQLPPPAFTDSVFSLPVRETAGGDRHDVNSMDGSALFAPSRTRSPVASGPQQLQAQAQALFSRSQNAGQPHPAANGEQLQGSVLKMLAAILHQTAVPTQQQQHPAKHSETEIHAPQPAPVQALDNAPQHRSKRMRGEDSAPKARQKRAPLQEPTSHGPSTRPQSSAVPVVVGRAGLRSSSPGFIPGRPSGGSGCKALSVKPEAPVLPGSGR